MFLELEVALIGLGWLIVLLGWFWLMGHFDDGSMGFGIEIVGCAALIWIPAAYLWRYGLHLLVLILLFIAPSAWAGELRDLFAWVHEDQAEACWGPKWQSDTERGSDAALVFGGYVRNQNKIRCDERRQCGPAECYFMGTLWRGDDGKTAWFVAPKGSFPPDITLMSAAPPARAESSTCGRCWDAKPRPDGGLYCRTEDAPFSIGQGLLTGNGGSGLSALQCEPGWIPVQRLDIGGGAWCAWVLKEPIYK